MELLHFEQPLNWRASRACQPVFQLGPDTCAQFRLPVPVFLLQSYFDHYTWQVWSALAYSPTTQTSMPFANVVERTPVTSSRIAQTVAAHVVSGDQNCKRLWSYAEGICVLRPEYIRSIANNTVPAKLVRDRTSM